MEQETEPNFRAAVDEMFGGEHDYNKSDNPERIAEAIKTLYQLGVPFNNAVEIVGDVVAATRSEYGE